MLLVGPGTVAPVMRGTVPDRPSLIKGPPDEETSGGPAGVCPSPNARIGPHPPREGQVRADLAGVVATTSTPPGHSGEHPRSHATGRCHRETRVGPLPRRSREGGEPGARL